MVWNLLDAMRIVAECLLMLAATALVMGLVGGTMVGGAVLAAKLTGARDARRERERSVIASSGAD